MTSDVWFQQRLQPSPVRREPRSYRASIELHIVALSEKHAQRTLDRLLSKTDTSTWPMSVELRLIDADPRNDNEKQ